MARTGLERPRLRGAEGGVEPARMLPGLTLEDQQASLLWAAGAGSWNEQHGEDWTLESRPLDARFDPFDGAGDDMSGSRARTACVAIGLAAAAGPGWAVTFETMNGAPVQMQPYADEPGAPTVTVLLGTPQPFAGLSSSPGTGGGSGLGGSSGSGSTTSSDALTTLLAQSSGATIIANAESIGVNGSAIAATCVLESGCQSLSGGSGAQGMFQMYPAAYQEGLQTALAANSSLASQIVPGVAGVNDPVTAGIAASGYLLQANTYLSNGGISNPTVIDVRGYYNFGPQGGANLATASSNDLMSRALPMYTQAQLSQNGISPGMTVGQWQASVARKIGNAASQQVVS